MEGEIEADIATTPAVRVEDNYRKILHDSRGIDRAAGRTLRGPHRSDLVVVHGPKQMAAGRCSTGEQKALLIGLILAQAHPDGILADVPVENIVAFIETVKGQ